MLTKARPGIFGDWNLSTRLIAALLIVAGFAISLLGTLQTKTKFDQYEAEISLYRAAAPQPVSTAAVYVAARPLRYGERLTTADILRVAWPSESLPEGAFTDSSAPLFPPNAPEFRSVLRAMEKGEPILELKVTPPGGEAGISARLSPGQRAFAIQVDVQTGVSGLLRPGDRVDVYWTGPSGTNAGLVTRLIETSLQIVAVDQSADADVARAAVARTITVQAAPGQVASLTQAQATGRLSLSLVGGADSVAATATDVSQADILGRAEPEPRIVEAPRSCTVTTRRAGEKSGEMAIACRN